MLEQHRFSLLLLISTVIHVAVIFTVSWTMPDPAPVSATLEVTLAQFQAEEPPESADFLAQANQTGSGTLEDRSELSTIEQAQFRDNDIRKTQQSQQQLQQVVNPETSEKLIATVQESWSQAKDQQALAHEAKEQADGQQHQRSQVSQEIASLEAELRNERKEFAKRPRRRQLTSVATKASTDAAYLNQWRQRVESVGNMNYPDLQVFGELTLLVSVRANGTIERIEVRRSSGYRSLDDAAIRIVRQSAPFDPFPEEIRRKTDILEIIRTWRFEKGGYLSSSYR